MGETVRQIENGAEVTFGRVVVRVENRKPGVLHPGPGNYTFDDGERVVLVDASTGATLLSLPPHGWHGLERAVQVARELAKYASTSIWLGDNSLAQEAPAQGE
jgi:hypothetical protein